MSASKPVHARSTRIAPSEDGVAECGWFPDSPAVRERVRAAIARAAAGHVERQVMDLVTGDALQTWEVTFVPEHAASGAVESIELVALRAPPRPPSPREATLEFLHALSEATRELSDPNRIMEVTCRMLGQHLRASRCAYADVEPDQDHFVIPQDYTDGCKSTVGHYSLDTFGPGPAADMREGRTLVLYDVEEQLTLETGLGGFRHIGITALVCCPLVKRGSLVAMMAVHQVQPRHWTDHEITLVGEVVERSWSSIERARAQAALRRKERQFEDLFENAPDATILIDAEGRIALANRGAEQLFGYTRAELTGQPLLTLLSSESAPVYEAARQTCRQQEEGAFRVLGRHHDGTEFPAEINLSGVGSRTRGMIAASVRDVSERERMQAQLQQSLKMETVGQLAGGVAHDFNNLLTVINATVELMMLRNDVSSPSIRKDLSTVLRAGEQAATLTRQLLALSRQQVLKPVLLDLNQVLKDMEPMLPRLIGENIAVRFRPAPEPMVVRVDRTQIDQVLLNLSLNSRDAMPQGGTLIIEVSALHLDDAATVHHEDLSPGPHVVLAVSDTGTGMDETTRRRIFEPFFTTKETGKGTGLGLSTVYGIVKQSGGGMSVYSEVGQGTTIKIFLPRHDVPADVPAQMMGGGLEGNETVLLIEDEADIREVATVMLERRGYTVLVAQSGAAALEIVRRHPEPIHLVLSDVIMPGESGPETVRAIQAVKPDIRVVYMSGYAAELLARHHLDEGPQHFVTKPFTLAELTRAVRRALED